MSFNSDRELDSLSSASAYRRSIRDDSVNINLDSRANVGPYDEADISAGSKGNFISILTGINQPRYSSLA